MGLKQTACCELGAQRGAISRKDLRNEGRYSRPLLDGAGDAGEHSVRVAADQPYRSYDNDQNDGHHDRVFGYILTGFFRPQVAKILSHIPPVCWRVAYRRSEVTPPQDARGIFSQAAGFLGDRGTSWPLPQ